MVGSQPATQCLNEQGACNSLLIITTVEHPEWYNCSTGKRQTTFKTMMDAPSSTLQACLNILQKIPPSKSAETIGLLSDLLASNPDALSEVSKTLFPLPLDVEIDPTTQKNFLKCELNRLGDSYRSPWSNTFVPCVSGDVPYNALRSLEAIANEVWESYRQLYYRHDSIGSVYLYETEEKDGSFTGVFLIQKNVSDETLAQGQWNSVHFVHVTQVTKGSSRYRIQSTVQVTMDPSEKTTIGARLTKVTDQSCVVSGIASHVENLGKLIESAEIEIRSNLENVQIPKTKEIVDGIRKEVRKANGPPSAFAMMGNHAAMLNQAVLARAAKK
jgi:capping protein (actin filament) muscle Z-line, beta